MTISATPQPEVSMNSIPIDRDSAAAALDRLIDVAQSNTGQSSRVANFLLA
jgi:hypothetical protein